MNSGFPKWAPYVLVAPFVTVFAVFLAVLGVALLLFFLGRGLSDRRDHRGAERDRSQGSLELGLLLLILIWPVDCGVQALSMNRPGVSDPGYSNL